ncbi:hypothetical protein [Salibacterium aidingense]|uniref:hypothetical protein n=1 Tax=Salibacterium aidingense TaxID=384933 RepID=UPI003BE6B8C8
MGLLIGIPAALVLNFITITAMSYSGIDVTPLLALLIGIIYGMIGGMIAIDMDA